MNPLPRADASPCFLTDLGNMSSLWKCAPLASEPKILLYPYNVGFYIGMGIFNI